MMYITGMLRINVYVPDELNKRLALTAKSGRKPKAEVIRQALEAGLKVIHPKSTTAQALLDLAKMAEKIPSRPGNPNDVSINHDYYAWGGEKRKK